MSGGGKNKLLSYREVYGFRTATDSEGGGSGMGMITVRMGLSMSTIRPG